MDICDFTHCTGCGMCSNVCPKNAITMKKKENGFIYPEINESLCVHCHLCEERCPANCSLESNPTEPQAFAAWSRDREIRRQSTSGGVFSTLAKYVLNQGGAVVGVRWTENFNAAHVMIEDISELSMFRGSKYVQSDTGDIYKQVLKQLNTGRLVLFSGTPCQNHALKQFLKREYNNLLLVDVVCHGVPSQEMFLKHQQEVNQFGVPIQNIRLRYKNPYWDYCNVRIDFQNGQSYQKTTMDDAYFNLFNIGYSLRQSCHSCKYTSTDRCSDITLADFWGYHLKSFKMRDYQKGTSLILVNSPKGKLALEKISTELVIERASLDEAVSGNKSLKEPFQLAPEKEAAFWEDYRGGMTVSELDHKYTQGTFHLPNLLFLRRLKNRWRWVKKHG